MEISAIESFDAAGYPTAPSSGNAYHRAALDRLMPLDESIWIQAAEKSLVFLRPFSATWYRYAKPLGRYRIHDANESSFSGHHLEALTGD